MCIAAILHRILDFRSRRTRLSATDDQAGQPDIQVISLPSSGATSALAKALQAVHLAESKS